MLKKSGTSRAGSEARRERFSKPAERQDAPPDKTQTPRR